MVCQVIFLLFIKILVKFYIDKIILKMYLLTMKLKLNSNKVRKMLKKQHLTLDDVARINGMRNRMAVFHYIKSESVNGAVLFAKALKCNPKDLISL